MPHRQPRITRNDYSVLEPAVPGAWRPRLSVSVVIPARNCQEKLDLTLAALSAQTYPAELLEVVVVDDDSDTPLRLPPIRPERTRIIGGAPGGWGIAHATNTGVEASDGDVVHRLDSDMVVFPDHIETQLRWHHLAEYLVVLGYKRFVEYTPGLLTPERIGKAAAAGTVHELFDADAGLRHEWVERIIGETDQLRSAHCDAFRVVVGSTFSLSRSLYTDCGGMDTGLAYGEDSEFGYRVAQSGAVFVPEPAARSWHLGLSTMMTVGEQVHRHSTPAKVDRMAQPRWRRKPASAQWTVPYVDVHIDASAGTYEQVASACQRLLDGALTDISIRLLAPWGQLSERRRSVLDDPAADLRLLQARFRADGRVSFVEEVEETSAPSPFRLTLNPTWAPHPRFLADLTQLADEHAYGLVAVGGPEGAPARLERTSAVARALRVRLPAEPLDAVVDELFGANEIDPDTAGLRPMSGLGHVRREPGSAPHPRSEAQLLRSRAQAMERRAGKLANSMARHKREFRDDKKALNQEIKQLRKQVARLQEREAQLLHRLEAPWWARKVKELARRARRRIR